jgi:hypothetical protein
LLEGFVAIVAGAVAGSISLMGFGIDSEATSGTALLWRMSVDANTGRREANERIALRVIGICFLALATYVAYEPTSHMKSMGDLIRRRTPEHSIPGIVLASASLLVMPVLSRAKRKVANGVGKCCNAR